MKLDAAADKAASEQLHRLPERLAAVDGFGEVIASLQQGHGATLDGVWGSSCALAAAALVPQAPAPIVVVCQGAEEADSFLEDFSLFSAVETLRFPVGHEVLPDERALLDEVSGERLRVLKQLEHAAETEGKWPRLIVTSIQALLRPVPERESLVAHTRRLAVGARLDLDELLEWLVRSGYKNMTAVELPGEFALHGGILDIFAPDWEEPVRVELFDDEIESLRAFEPQGQRSLRTLQSAEITVLPTGTQPRGHFAEYLPAESWFLLVEPGELADEARHYLQRLERPQDAHSHTAVLEQVLKFPSVTASSIATGSLEATCQLKVESVERFSGEVGRVKDELELAGAGQQVYVVCHNEAEAKRLAEIFADSAMAQQGRLHFPIGRLKSGFRLPQDQIVLVSGSELFHRSDPARPVRRRLGRAIDSFLDLREGDYVVHLSHGIGRYLGLKVLEKGQGVEEHLELQFADDTKIYVPTSKIDLVQKYVGGTKSRPTLAKIGGKSWAKQKARAAEAVVDLAADMLDLQASRASRPGIAYPDDSEWQLEFEAAFPYTETPDQMSAITALKTDMRQPRPMDRLICGDVGYGKTEVAMRAAFKAVDSGHQVAVLVPTTVLAEQHGRTFAQRMAEFPFSIATLSRFRTKKEQRAILEGVAEGSIDIVIGTHRLAQKDVQFQNLGLVIIDEEQRFGVEVKERLKAIRHVVDVLTLTATPIPRTLHFSLLGLRDISNLETPPAERLAVETRVTRFDPTMIRQAILRELNRRGQIYFVHNKVYDIQAVARRLQEIVPEARIAIGHGQMGEGELEEVMLGFVDHQYDILLATTIIESGLDIPNANTIFIDQADRYGLADLHQLRGRVGRYKHRAYCYLLIDPNQSLTSEAAKRLRAIEEFSEMGAGFSIALRDLEIRGAGNILGTEQSGHISAVGYELYCELLEQAVRQLKKMPPKQSVDVEVDLPGEAYFPRAYVSDMRQKIDLYRRLGRLGSLKELNELAAELQDRFGPRPPLVEKLLSRMEVRIRAAHWRINSIHQEDSYLVFGYTNPRRIEQLRAESGNRLRIVDKRSAYLPLPKGVTGGEQLEEICKSLLQVN